MYAAFDPESYKSLPEFYQDWEETLGYTLLLYKRAELLKIAEDSCCRLPQIAVLPELVLVFARLLASSQKVFSEADDGLKFMIDLISKQLVYPITENYVRYMNDGQLLQEDREQACGSDRTPRQGATFTGIIPVFGPF